jgi:hypothetical protein
MPSSKSKKLPTVDSSPATSNGSSTSDSSTSDWEHLRPMTGGAVLKDKILRAKKPGHRLDFFATLLFGYLSLWLFFVVFISYVPKQLHGFVYWVRPLPDFAITRRFPSSRLL